MMIIYTIHQPSFEIFKMFDNLLILNRGIINYFGRADEAEDYYAEMGKELPPNKNPIDFFIEISIKSTPEQ